MILVLVALVAVLRQAQVWLARLRGFRRVHRRGAAVSPDSRAAFACVALARRRALRLGRCGA
jgi:hypothetical protein